MTRYEWSPEGLIPALSEKLELGEESADGEEKEQFSPSASTGIESGKRGPNKRKLESTSPGGAENGGAPKRRKKKRASDSREGDHQQADNTAEESEEKRKREGKEKREKKKAKEPVMIPETIWSRIAKLRRKENARLSKLLGHLSLRLDRATFDYERDGTIRVQGRQVPGSDLLKILRSVTSKKELEIGEILVLQLLAHSPPSIRQIVHKKKLHFTRTDEADPDEFKPVLRADRVRQKGTNSRAVRLPSSKGSLRRESPSRASSNKRSTRKKRTVSDLTAGGGKASGGSKPILTSEKDVPGKVNIDKRDVYPGYLPTRRSNAITSKASLPGDNLAHGLGRKEPTNKTWYLLTESSSVKPNEFIS